MEGKKYQITVQDTGERFVYGEDEFVLSAMKQANCGPIHYGCFGGGCGFCKMKVVSGAVHAAKRMSRQHVSQSEQEPGIVLICCIQPRGNVIITRV